MSSDVAASEALLRAFPGLQGDPAALHALLGAVSWRWVPRHEHLCRIGDPADGMYVLASGKLLVMPDGGATPRHVSPGESVGTWALFTGDGERSADVVAVHASWVGHLDRASFETLTVAHPAFLREVAASMVRYERARDTRPEPQTTVLALVPLDVEGPVRRVGEALRAALADLGPCVAYVPDLSEDPRAVRATLDRLTEVPGHVLLIAPSPRGSCTELMITRADHVILLAEAGAPAVMRPQEWHRTEADRRAGIRASLLLVHPQTQLRPRGTASWLEARDVDDHHHVRASHRADIMRAARLLTGRGIGLVLSGGSALGAAHIGVLAALLERGVPIDMLGGTSAGGGIAAVLARHGAYEPVHDAICQAFFVHNPIGRMALPTVALTAGAPLDATARWLCGDVQIEDLWVPWFGVSTSLTSGALVLHRRGAMWRAVRATTSIPGLMPPVLSGDEVLVDGGLLDNFPVGAMKALCGGPVLGSNVLGPWRERATSRGPLRRLLDRLVGSSDLPGLVSTLSRVATLGGQVRADGVPAPCDITFQPDMSSFSLGRFNRFAERARQGYDHAVEVLDATDLSVLLPGWSAGDVPAFVPPDPRRGNARDRFGVIRR